MLALTAIAPATALAWGNGPNAGAGFGTHDWILTTANRFAVSQGTTWLDVDVATRASGEPDLISGDQRYHAYDRWGKHYGFAPTRVAALYSQAVTLYRNGDRAGASRAVGLLSHYYADVCEPLHTDDSKPETRMHGPFERVVDKMLRSPSSCRSWASYDGYGRASNPSAFTVSAAKYAHASYSNLVKTYKRHGFNKAVRAIARRSVNHAANGVADVIMSVQQDAIEATNSPNVSAHQGVAVGEDFYYIFHTDRITRYDRSWVATGTNDVPFEGLDGFTEPHLGDGCYHNGKLYVVAENWPAVTNQQILVFDANTLQRLAAIPTGKTHEVASICVAPNKDGTDVFWIASYLDSTHLFQYDIDDCRYVGETTLSPAPLRGIQGIDYHDGQMYIACGASENVGFLYSASVEGSTTLLYTRRSPGAHEGLASDGNTLLWLVDQGATGSRVWYLRLPGFLATLR
jgi:hypothetical protein